MLEVRVPREGLMSLIKMATKAVLDETAIVEACTHVLLAADAGRLTVSGSNMVFQIRDSMSASVEGPGAVLVPAFRFLGLLRTFSEEELVLRVTPKHWVSYKCGRNKGRLKGLNADEFPRMPELDVLTLQMAGSSLIRQINQTIYSVARVGEKSEVLEGVFCRVRGNEISFVATDGQRLSRSDGDMLAEGEMTGVIPADSVRMLRTLVPRDNQEVSFALSSSSAQFRVNGVSFTTRLIDKVYPEYAGLIPDTWKLRVTFKTPKILQALRSARVFTPGRVIPVYLTFSIPAGEVTVMGRDGETGDVRTIVDVEYEGSLGDDRFSIKMGARLLLDCLRRMDSDEVAFEMRDKVSPMAIRIPGVSSFVYVLAPMA